MRTIITKSGSQKLRGSILAISLLLVAIASIGSLLMVRTLLDHQRLNDRRRELSRAYYAAESGIDIVKHWGNFPEDYPDDPSMFVRVIPTPNPSNPQGLVNLSADPEMLFPDLASAIGSGGIEITQDELHAMALGEFDSDHGYGVAIIKNVQILPADTSAGLPPHFFRILSVGESVDGIERTVLAYMDINPIMALRLPAAVMSYNNATSNGNARIHWGEVWTKYDIDMLNKSQMNYLIPGDADYDPWAKYRTEGQIDFPANWQWGAGDDLFDDTQVQPGAAPASGDYEEAFFQHLPAGSIQWPDFNYQDFKDLAISHGRYYSTDSSGNIYRDGIEDAAHEVDFADEFTVADRDAAPYDIVFIDTIDGNPPAADGSNLATISVSGNGLALKGVYWIGANFDAGGVGSPPSLDADDPDDTTTTLEKIFADGVLYAAGTIQLSGNAGIYGAIFAQGGFTGSGTPDVYYNADLADGLIIENGNVGSMFRVVMQINY